MPNHKMTSGIKARCGIFRNIWMDVSKSKSEYFEIPLNKPNKNPITPPIKNPASALHRLMETCSYNSPVPSRESPAWKTSLGAGNIFSGMIPIHENTCQQMSNKNGTTQGTICFMDPFIRSITRHPQCFHDLLHDILDMNFFRNNI